MALTIGEFIAKQQANQDGPGNPYNPKTESYLELAQPEVPFQPLGASQLPPPPPVVLSSPAGLPPPPDVTLSSPTALPPEPPPPHSVPAVLPDEPAPPPSIPAALPTEPAPAPSVPAVLPAPPNVITSVPAALAPEPAPPPGVNATLPPPPAVVPSLAANLPPPPDFRPAVDVAPPPPPKVAPLRPAKLPKPPDFASMPNAVLDPPPPFSPDTGYKLGRETYSPIGGTGEGVLALDPAMHERQLERAARLSPGQMAVHVMTQVGLQALNVYGTVWNPAMVAPPPGTSDVVLPALDLDFDGTAKLQLQIGSLVDEALDGNLVRLQGADEQLKGGGVLAVLPPSTSLKRAFENVKAGVANLRANRLSQKPVKDPLLKTAFCEGIIPMKLKGESRFGFHSFKGGADGGVDKTNDDDMYVPLSFCDLRPVGNNYRIVYFRPLITGFSEALTPEWNKTQYMGRVDPVATYQSTGRQVALSFKLVAFGPEDVRTIYQKLHWLSSMVYPEYDSNLGYKSGPVVRMRVGDVINALGPEGARGLPGVIDSLNFDYSDKLWELKKGWKVPREIDVSLGFTVLHDVPIGRGNEGLFGGLGQVQDGVFEINDPLSPDDNPTPLNPRSNVFRRVGASEDFTYKTLEGVTTDNDPAAGN